EVGEQVFGIELARSDRFGELRRWRRSRRCRRSCGYRRHRRGAGPCRRPRGRRSLLALVEREEHLETVPAEAGQGPVDLRPEALLQAMEEAGVRRQEDELVTLRARLERTEPGRELLGVELLLELLLEERPEGFIRH